jgi:hypothetical protein
MEWRAKCMDLEKSADDKVKIYFPGKFSSKPEIRPYENDEVRIYSAGNRLSDSSSDVQQH